ncbi:hypothetical protein [Oceanithermus desulfurans]
MRNLTLALLLLAVLSACNINIILPGTPIVVDGPAVESGVLGEGESARFELLVGADPVRIDATDVTNAAAGSLRLRVFDANNAVYAQTVSRQYFTAPQPEVLGSGAVGLGITPNPIYSINLPANFGKAYVEVTNLSGDPTVVRAAAVTRQDGVEKNNAYSFNATATGALLYLGQLDTWTYTGTGPATLELVGGTTVHARAKVVRGFDTQTVLEPGEEFTDLQNGDVVYVQAQGSGALAGFCNTLPGCADGITSGEYTLQVTP